MSKKKKLLAAIVLICGVLLNVAIIMYHLHLSDGNRMITCNVTLTSDVPNEFQVYYLTKDQNMPADFAEAQSSKASYGKAGETSTLSFTIPGNAAYVRLDFGTVLSNTEVSGVELKYKLLKEKLAMDEVLKVVDSAQVKVEETNDALAAESTGNDPYIVWSTENWNAADLWGSSNLILFWGEKILLCLFIDAILFVILKKFEQFTDIPKDVFRNRRLIFNLAKSDFKTRFAGSFFGTVWAFVQPIITVLVYWFVFEKGLRASGINTKSGIEVPFVLWLIAGMVPWFFFSEALSGGTNALMEYSYLVKKVVFNISILPVVKIVSALFVHLFFIAFTLVLYTCYQYYPDLYTLQIFYYSFAMLLFTLALVYSTCAIVIFFRDLSQIINIILQIGVWITPIMWNIDTMDIAPALKSIFKLNPLYYIVAGYRDALINKIWFWESPGLTLYFWIITVVLFGIGSLIFRRLRVHFADVL